SSLPSLSPLFPYTTLFRSVFSDRNHPLSVDGEARLVRGPSQSEGLAVPEIDQVRPRKILALEADAAEGRRQLAPVRRKIQLPDRSEEHTSELQSLRHLVCR